LEQGSEGSWEFDAFTYMYVGDALRYMEPVTVTRSLPPHPKLSPVGAEPYTTLTL